MILWRVQVLVVQPRRRGEMYFQHSGIYKGGPAKVSSERWAVRWSVDSFVLCTELVVYELWVAETRVVVLSTVVW
jgi:hypothetical protein